MAPVALAAVWLGPPWLSALVLAAAAGMGWEWARLCLRGAGFGLDGALVLATEVLSVGALSVGAAGSAEAAGAAACLVALGGSAAVFLAAVLTRSAEPPWIAGGTLWIALGALAFLWLAIAPQGGREAILWLLGIVWATDIGAYAAGRSIGGPKLAPRLSPNKTWAGLAGGVVSAALVGLLAARLTGGRPLIPALASAILAVIAQAGDLAESLAKRHFGVKDSSNLIPGHGGLLDRLDGLLTAAMAAALMALVAGEAPLAWR